MPPLTFVRVTSYNFSEYTFPFEGNWNLAGAGAGGLGFAGVSEYTFPFEGNWNLSATPMLYPLIALNTLSRLKGIETDPIPLFWVSFSRALNTLSRLKGIETCSHDDLSFFITPLWIHFPVWRELKLRIALPRKTFSLMPLNTLSRLKGIETLISFFS